MTDRSRVRSAWDVPEWPSLSSSEYPDSIQSPQNVKTPGTSIDTKPDQGAFEVKVIGYGTSAPSLSISAPSQASTGAQDELSAPMKIIATVEHDGQQHELSTTFKSLKVSHAANAEASPATMDTKATLNEEEKENRYSSQDKITALAMKLEERLKLLLTRASEKILFNNSTKDHEILGLARDLNIDIAALTDLASPLSQFATTNNPEDLKANILADIADTKKHVNRWEGYSDSWKL